MLFKEVDIPTNFCPICKLKTIMSKNISCEEIQYHCSSSKYPIDSHYVVRISEDKTYLIQNYFNKNILVQIRYYQDEGYNYNETAIYVSNDNLHYLIKKSREPIMKNINNPQETFEKLDDLIAFI